MCSALTLILKLKRPVYSRCPVNWKIHETRANIRRCETLITWIRIYMYKTESWNWSIFRLNRSKCIFFTIKVANWRNILQKHEIRNFNRRPSAQEQLPAENWIIFPSHWKDADVPCRNRLVQVVPHHRFNVDVSFENLLKNENTHLKSKLIRENFSKLSILWN